MLKTRMLLALAACSLTALAVPGIVHAATVVSNGTALNVGDEVVLTSKELTWKDPTVAGWQSCSVTVRSKVAKNAPTPELSEQETTFKSCQQTVTEAHSGPFFIYDEKEGPEGLASTKNNGFLYTLYGLCPMKGSFAFRYVYGTNTLKISNALAASSCWYTQEWKGKFDLTTSSGVPVSIVR